MYISPWPKSSSFNFASTFQSVVLLIFALEFCTAQAPAECSRKHSMVNSADLRTLQFAQVIFRHGDRNPLDSYPNDPYKYPEYWHEGEGQLTKNGKKMGYELGQYLRWRYDGFLDSVYSPNEVFAKSSDFDRTIMTCLTVLAGLYPTEFPDRFKDDINWQPIPIRTIPPADDHILAFYYENCPRYHNLLFEVANSTEIKHIDYKHKDLYKYLQKHTGLPSVGWKEAGLLYDTLHIQTLNNLKLPNWARGVYPDRMLPLFQLGFKILSYTDEMRQLRGGPLLTEMIYNMESTIRRAKHVSHNTDNILAEVEKHFRPAKLFLYSGHDTTITTFLATLGLYDYQHIPGYTSMIIFELHKESCGEYFVRLLYRSETNGKAPIELEIPNCIQDCDNTQVCKFTKFKTLMAHFNVTNWDKHCQTGLPSAVEYGLGIGQKVYDYFADLLDF